MVHCAVLGLDDKNHYIIEAGGGQADNFKFDVTHVNGLKDDIAMIQTRLSEKLREGRTVSLELGSVQTQRDKLAAENTRLGHRIQYLEEQVASLESGMKQVRRRVALSAVWDCSVPVQCGAK